MPGGRVWQGGPLLGTMVRVGFGNPVVHHGPLHGSNSPMREAPQARLLCCLRTRVKQKRTTIIIIILYNNKTLSGITLQVNHY